ncbi:MAG: hypothetical protein ABSH21_04155 [Verrucomicrobiia bacterium]
MNAREKLLRDQLDQELRARTTPDMTPSQILAVLDEVWTKARESGLFNARHSYYGLRSHIRAARCFREFAEL